MHNYICVSKLNAPSLVQTMACCLNGTKPLSDSMVAYCQLEFQMAPWKFHTKYLGNTVKDTGFIQY